MWTSISVKRYTVARRNWTATPVNAVRSQARLTQSNGIDGPSRCPSTIVLLEGVAPASGSHLNNNNNQTTENEKNTEMLLLVFGIQPCWLKCYMTRKKNPPVPRELLKAARCRTQVSGPASPNLMKNPVAAGQKTTSLINQHLAAAGRGRSPARSTYVPRNPNPKCSRLSTEYMCKAPWDILDVRK